MRICLLPISQEEQSFKLRGPSCSEAVSEGALSLTGSHVHEPRENAPDQDVPLAPDRIPKTRADC